MTSIASGSTEAEIQEIVDRETRAWDERNVALLLTCFHSDMVWPWPPTARDHDPIDWVMEWGRFDAERWGRGWQELFDSHDLVRNVRSTERIEVSEQGDGAFAVVDIDTLWCHRESGVDVHWRGRTCKIYVKSAEGWKMTAQVGVLNYRELAGV
jgi:hypothetical protein